MVDGAMKLGLIADVHGNIAALEAVLTDMPPVDAVLCAGDVVGYYPHPNQVCDRLRRLGAWVVRGNHDAYVSEHLPFDQANDRAYRATWTRRHLEPGHLAWLKTLPVEIDFKWGGRRVRLRHASPWDEETYLYPDSPALRDLKLNAAEILVVGHTHHPLAMHCGEGLLVNPGSIGQPRDWNPLASYAVLELESCAVSHRRVAYDVAGLQRELMEMGWETKTIQVLSRERGR
jgi:putative phosphoesterase